MIDVPVIFEINCCGTFGSVWQRADPMMHTMATCKTKDFIAMR